MTASQSLKVEYRKTADLIPYINNARTHSEEQVSQIAASIKEFGFNNPILLDGANGVIAGHGRLMAAKKLKLEKVPCIELSHLTETQKKAYILADNKIALNADWDNSILALELEELNNAGVDLSDIGFNDEELDGLLAGEDSLTQDPIDDFYTHKIDSIQYEPSELAPSSLDEMVDETKTQALIEEVRNSDLKPEEKQLLILAAYRHLKFNYKKVADFYAHASPQCQALMEKSALVIIDYEDAVKNGYVRITKQLREIAGEEDANDGA